MRILKVFNISLLAIVCLITARGTQATESLTEIQSDDQFYFRDQFLEGKGFSDSYGNNTNAFLFMRSCIDIRSKSLAIMNMIDKNGSKTKEKILSVHLEVELNILIDTIKIKINALENQIERTKKEIYSNNNQNQDNIRNALNGMKATEEQIEELDGALYLAKQWKRDYCH